MENFNVNPRVNQALAGQQLASEEMLRQTNQLQLVGRGEMVENQVDGPQLHPNGVVVAESREDKLEIFKDVRNGQKFVKLNGEIQPLVKSPDGSVTLHYSDNYSLRETVKLYQTAGNQFRGQAEVDRLNISNGQVMERELFNVTGSTEAISQGNNRGYVQNRLGLPLPNHPETAAQLNQLRYMPGNQFHIYAPGQQTSQHYQDQLHHYNGYAQGRPATYIPEVSQYPGYQNGMATTYVPEVSQYPGYQNGMPTTYVPEVSQYPGYQNGMPTTYVPEVSQYQGYQNGMPTTYVPEVSQYLGYQNGMPTTYMPQLSQYLGYQYGRPTTYAPQLTAYTGYEFGKPTTYIPQLSHYMGYEFGKPTTYVPQLTAYTGYRAGKPICLPLPQRQVLPPAYDQPNC